MPHSQAGRAFKRFRLPRKDALKASLKVNPTDELLARVDQLFGQKVVRLRGQQLHSRAVADAAVIFSKRGLRTNAGWVVTSLALKHAVRGRAGVGPAYRRAGLALEHEHRDLGAGRRGWGNQH